MADANDLTDAIVQAATDPDSVSMDGMHVKGVPLSDVVAADKYLAAKKAASRNHLGCSYRKFVPQD